MNWKAWIHSSIVALLSIVVGAVEQYFQSGGVVPQNSVQWHSFLASVAGTILLAIGTLLKQSPIQGSVLDPAPGGVQAANKPVSVIAPPPPPQVLISAPPVPRPSTAPPTDPPA